nr:GAF domain-containing protein [Anaerolineae bacterium]
MDSSVKKRTLSLRTRVLVTFTSSAFITFAVIIVSISLFINRIERDSWLARQEESAKATSYQIRTFIDQVQKSQSLLNFLQTVLDEDNYGRLLSLMLLLGRNVDEIVVIDEDGNVLFDVARDEPVLISRVSGQEDDDEASVESEEDWLEATRGLAQGQFFLGELELDAEGNPYLVISSPNRVGGIMAFRINAQVVSDLIGDLKFGETGNAYLAEAEGQVIAHTDFSVVLNRTTLEGRPELIEAEDQDYIGNLLEVEIENTIVIGEEYTNFRGESVLGVRKVIHGTDVIIFVEISQSEAFATSRNALLLLSGFLVFSTLFSMYGFVRFSNDLVFKPLTNLQAGQQEIEKGNLGYQIPVLRDDELGRATAGFNLMSKQLDERNHQRIEQEKRLRALYDVMAQPFQSIDLQLQQALKVGAEFLGMDIGIISQIEGDRYTVLYAYTADDTLKSGQEFEFKKTYCDLTYQANDLVNIQYMKESAYYQHPSYAAFGLESYIGVPLVVAGKRFGTLNFSSPTKRAIPFFNEDKDFFVLMGKWVSTVLERYYAEKSLRASEADNRMLIENSPSNIIRLDKNKNLSFLHFPGASSLQIDGIIG